MGSLAYYFKFPSYFTRMKWHINSLEMFNFLLAMRVFGNLIKGRRLAVFLDNTTAVANLAQGITPDPLRLHTSKEVRILTGILDLTLDFCHIPGSQLLRHADALSRAGTDPQFDVIIDSLRDKGVTVFQYPEALFLPPLVL